MTEISRATTTLAEFVSATDPRRLPRDVCGRAVSLVLDLVGIAIRARHDADSTPSLLRAAERLGGLAGAGGARVFGDTRRWTPTSAAFLNGALAHSLDFDDTHARGSVHPSAPVVPAALAAAELVDARGDDVVAAIVAGYEVTIRLSVALDPSAHYARGFHPTSTCGAFGAAAAASRVLGLDAAATCDAFGGVLSQAAGTMQFLQNGAWTKRSQVGFAAQAGLAAAVLASEGFRGAGEALEGVSGFLHAYAPEPDVAAVVDGLGERFETLRIAIKPYPSCRYSHAAIDALRGLREEHPLAADDVHDVEIGLPETGWRLIGQPASDKARPRTITDGQFSMPFLAAVTLRDGDMTWDSYGVHLQDTRTRALTAKVRTVVDPRAEAEFPEQMSGVARVRTAHGELERFVKIPSGEPECFPSPEDQARKFVGLTCARLGEARAAALVDRWRGLADVDSVRALMIEASAAP